MRCRVHQETRKQLTGHPPRFIALLEMSAANDVTTSHFDFEKAYP
jgi:hypothetical protein